MYIENHTLIVVDKQSVKGIINFNLVKVPTPIMTP